MASPKSLLLSISDRMNQPCETHVCVLDDIALLKISKHKALFSHGIDLYSDPRHFLKLP
jgi:hypothetical protein